MAICAQVDATGVVRAAGNIPLNDCAGFVMLDKADYVQNGLIQSLMTIPTGDDFATAWQAGFVTPMAIGLVAWACAAIIGMFRDRDND